MKTFKRIDLLIQAVLIVVFAIVFGADTGSTLCVILFEIIAAWQVLSLIIHFVNRWHPYKGGRRYNFQLALAGCLIMLCLIRTIDALNAIVYPFAFLLLLMPLYHFRVCFMEVFHYTKRPLELI
jgi:hypothetical protein